MNTPPQPIDPLTPKQQEVLRLRKLGLSYRTIALTLRISQSTVRTHLEAARHKLANPKGHL